MTHAWARKFRGTPRFRPIQKLGEGGMGVVYEADDLARGERVAIKVLHRADPEALRRFKQEYRALSDLEHPNLVRLGELHEADDAWFFSMELVQGVDLYAYIHGLSQAAPRDETSKRKVTPQGPAQRPEAVLARLRATFAQLASALAALHAAGKVHCDIKPSNVLVTPEGRVVVLDFGLVLEGRAVEASETGRVFGTAAYMAPEQTREGGACFASDWYAFGVVLYEALTGALPFAGDPLQVLLDKGSRRPARPSEVAVRVPRDLDELCVALLHPDPRVRPSDEEVLALLGRSEPISSELKLPNLALSTGERTPFVGRRAELDRLHALHAEVLRGDALVVSVEGPSGLGKSTLLAHFAAEARGRHPDLVVLSGRCYERETARFKALDGVIDALSSELLKLTPVQRRELTPRHAALLRKRFPALARIDVIGRAAPVTTRFRDAVEERRLTFAALRELLARLADRQPLVLTIDDMQWADGDSVELLRALLDPSHDAPPRMLVAVTSREPWTDLASDGFGRERWPGALHVVSLGSLSDVDAEALAREHLVRLGRADVDPAALVREAAGHPLFVAELALCAHDLPGSRPANLTLDEAIWQRASALPDQTLAVLALLAVAAVPLSPLLIASALGKSPTDVDRHLVALRLGAFVKTVGKHDQRRIEPYHDRVRESVLGHLDRGARREIHALLAPRLDAEPGIDPELVAQHYVDAGDKERASALFARAAQTAEEGLAFERAALLYRAQLELGRLSARERSLMFRRLGSALVKAGRSRAGADAYQASLAGAADGERVPIQSTIAGCLLRSGHVSEGLEVLEGVLRSVDMRLPRSHAQALASFAWERARVYVGGYDTTLRDESAITPVELQRADALFAVAQGLSLVDGIRCAPVAARALRAALRTGERARVVRALAAEASTLSLGGRLTQPSALRALAALRRAVKGADDPLLHGYVLGAESTYCNNHALFSECFDKANQALAIFDAPGVEAQWERAYVRSFRIFAQFYLGRMREMYDEGEEALRDAQVRRDRWFESLLRIGPCSLGVVEEDLARARALNEEGFAPWRDRTPGFLFWCWFVKTVALDLVEGRWDLAIARYDQHRREIALTGSWYVPTLRAHLCAYRAVAQLERFRATNDAAALREADAWLVRMRPENGFMHGWADLVRAQLAEARGRPDESVELAERAADGFRSVQAERFLRMTEAYLGLSVGGTRGRELELALGSYFARERLSRWDTLVAPFVPALARH